MRPYAADSHRTSVLLSIVLLAALWALVPGCAGSNQPAPTTTAPTTQTSAKGRFVVSYKPETDSAAVNQMQSWLLHVETRDGRPVDGARIAVSGGMPDMGHGLPTAPQVSRGPGQGDYKVEGLEFSMPGAWVVTFTIRAEGTSDKASFQLYVK